MQVGSGPLGPSHRVSGSTALPERPAALLLALPSGKADVLSGRYVYPQDDLDRLIAEAREIDARTLYSLQIQRL